MVWRRWYVALPLLVGTVVVALSVSNGIAPEYHATGSVILLGPTGPVSSGDPSQPQVQAGLDNPYAGSLGITATALQLAATSAETTSELRDAGLSVDYDISVPSRAPILNIVASADTPKKAVDTAHKLAEILGDRLQERETAVGVPADARIKVDVLRMSDQASTDVQGQRRTGLLVFALGVAISIAAAFAVDGIAAGLRRRKARADRRSEEVYDDPSTDGPRADHAPVDGRDRTDTARPPLALESASDDNGDSLKSTTTQRAI